MGNSQSSGKLSGNEAAGGQVAVASQVKVRVNSNRWIQTISASDVRQRKALKPAQAYGVEAGYMPLTELNHWPEKLANQDIVPLLLDEDTLSELGFNKEFIEFSKFVKNWYSCSCAVVYHAPKGPVIIGSGNYLGDLTISTARHVYDELKYPELSIRFFKYFVRETSREGENSSVFVQQDYIDVPISRKENGRSGLDAGFLYLESNAEKIVTEYAKVLPCPSLDRIQVNRSGASNLSRGVYALFHFAGGEPLVSVGRVDAAPAGAAWFKPVVDVFSGPGSSGGAAIGQYGQRVAGEALHICRSEADSYDNRRFIKFSKIREGGCYNEIEAPYKAEKTLGNDGYLREFLRYDPAKHGGRRNTYKKQFKSPYPPLVRKYGEKWKGKLQRHHIIPIDDMIYLYEYFSRLDRETSEKIRKLATEQAKKIAEQKRNANTQTPNFPQDMSVIKKEQREDEIANFKKRYELEVRKRYSVFHDIISKLTPHPLAYQLANDEIKLFFSYAKWNLFHGYKERSDDPKNDGTPDYSEKKKPVSFNSDLWTLLKHETTGLFVRIKLLQRLSMCGKRTPEVMKQEEELRRSLTGIFNLTKGPGRIHQFDEEDWVPKRGLYRLKSDSSS